MRYEKAQKCDLPALTGLWQRCFGDSESSIWEFWKIFDRISVFVARDKTPVAMLCALPVAFFDECGEAYSASYLYAICTDDAYRGRGICAKLMTNAEDALKKEGNDFAFLTPASETLFDFYKKMGYETSFYHERFTVRAEGKAKIQKINAAAYQNLRQMQLYSNFVSYSDDLIALHGGLYRIETKETVCCAAAQRNGDELIIQELLPKDVAAAAALAAHLGCRHAFACTEGGEIPFAMAKSLGSLPCPKHAYLGLAFD